MVDRSTALQAAFTAVARISKPTVAAVTGYALGGGLELALACDRRVSVMTPRLVSQRYCSGSSLAPAARSGWPRLVGPSRAKDMIYTSRFVGADEALRVGLVDEVVAPVDVYATAVEWASQFADGPANALRAAKEAIDRGLETDLDTGLEIERHQFASLFAAQDRTVGMESFIEHGPGKARFGGS